MALDHRVITHVLRLICQATPSNGILHLKALSIDIFEACIPRTSQVILTWAQTTGYHFFSLSFERYGHEG
jgi:hypothetical protein